MRAAGSSPSVVAPDAWTDEDAGVHQGLYRRGAWICLDDADAWRRHDSTEGIASLLLIYIKFFF